MVITEKTDGNVLMLSIEGNIDTISSGELQQKILTSFQKYMNIVLDVKGVNYMSSAGLRALLLGHKTALSKGGTLKLINVQPIVERTFEISGFTSILNIE